MLKTAGIDVMRTIVFLEPRKSIKSIFLLIIPEAWVAENCRPVSNTLLK